MSRLKGHNVEELPQVLTKRQEWKFIVGRIRCKLDIVK